MNLLLLEASELADGGRVTLVDERAEHVRRVLRALPGQEVRAGVVDGPMGQVRVVEVHPDRVVFDASALSEAPVPARPRVDLLLALPRPKVFARLLPAIAELGVGQLDVTNAAKVERYYFDSHQLAPEEIRRRLLVGLSQAKDTRLPLVRVFRSFRKLVEDELPEGSRRIYADTDAALPSPGALVRGADRVLLAIGPEGGWVDFELGLLQRNGFVGGSFGPRVLSSDVACLVALGLVHDALRG